MQEITLIINGAPYGTEGPYNALRLAAALLSGADKPALRLFLMSDAVFSAKRGQKVPQGYYNVAEMLSESISGGAAVKLCGTCCRARGMTQEDLIDGAEISSMIELRNYVLESDKVISF
ncbi:MAG: DsrE/DsrF/TusD sulfur relay family protein [Candidatus Geothermincolia bacterium]